MAEIWFSFDVCLCVANQSSDQFKTVKATDFKFDTRFQRQSYALKYKYLGFYVVSAL